MTYELNDANRVTIIHSCPYSDEGKNYENSKKKKKGKKPSVLLSTKPSGVPFRLQSKVRVSVNSANVGCYYKRRVLWGRWAVSKPTDFCKMYIKSWLKRGEKSNSVLWTFISSTNFVKFSPRM